MFVSERAYKGQNVFVNHAFHLIWGTMFLLDLAVTDLASLSDSKPLLMLSTSPELELQVNTTLSMSF